MSALLICAAPFLFLGAVELWCRAYRRRHRRAAVVPIWRTARTVRY